MSMTLHTLIGFLFFVFSLTIFLRSFDRLVKIKKKYESMKKAEFLVLNCAREKALILNLEYAKNYLTLYFPNKKNILQKSFTQVKNSFHFDLGKKICLNRYYPSIQTGVFIQNKGNNPLWWPNWGTKFLYYP
ncbi:MAG: hypothetical protein CMP11_06595 [Zetaproteobacteria bacterium]|nr:hypothetical protein [Pseudobdellovibrionaceae bacterium]